MTTPRPETRRKFDPATSRALLLEADIRWPDDNTRLAFHFVAELLLAIEAEAVAAERERIRLAVRHLYMERGLRYVPETEVRAIIDGAS